MVLQFKVDAEGGYTGDFEALRKALEIHPKVVDNGIGSYEFWGQRCVDHQWGAEIEDEGAEVRLEAAGSKSPDFNRLVYGLIEAAGALRTKEFADEGWVEEDDEGRPYRSRRGTGVTATFTLRVVGLKQDSPVSATCTLQYE